MTPQIKSERLLLFTLAFIQFSHIVDFMLIMPLGPQLYRYFHISAHHFSFLVSSYTFCASLLGFISASFLDRFDRKKAVMVTFLGFTVGTFLCGLAPSFHLLLLFRGITGAFGGVLAALTLSVIADVIPFERRSAAMGWVMASFSVASVVGVPFGLYLANLWGWKMPFLILGMSGLLVLISIQLFIPSIKGHLKSSHARESFFKHLKNIIAPVPHQTALLLTTVIMLGQFSVIPFISAYLVANVGFSEGQLPLVYLFGGAITIFTSPVIGKLADKWGLFKTFTLFALISTLPMFVITHLTPSPIAFVITFTTLLFICAGGRMIPATTLITGVVPASMRGGFMSINACIQQFSMGLASLIAGQIIQQGPTGPMYHYPTVGYIAIGASFIAIGVAYKLNSFLNSSTKAKA